ncbi:MAG: hypothetical protein GX781_06845 [Clostridiales bacterium]|nr:hypothetical protein [Clostridiales bacterium]
MKKTLSLVLGCLIALTAITAVQAEPFYLEDAGISIEIPEGMTVEDISSQEAYALAITVDGDANLKYAFSLNFIDEFEDKYLEDLTQEENDLLMMGLAVAIPDLQYEAVETEMFNLLVVSSPDGTQLHYITLLGGWLFDVAVGRGDGPLTDEDMQAAAQMMMTLGFDEE